MWVSPLATISFGASTLSVRGPPHSRSAGSVRALASNADNFGRDPRSSFNSVVADYKWAAGQRPGCIEALGSVNQLQAALDAVPRGSLVVLKFERDGCKACIATAKPFEQMAKRLGKRTGSRFFTVDTLAHKEFCRDQVGIKAVPCVHIYQENALRRTLQISATKWPTFREAVESLTVDLYRSPAQGVLARLRSWTRMGLEQDAAQTALTTALTTVRLASPAPKRDTRRFQSAKRDARTIVLEGLGNLAKEPLGWLAGAKPLPLTSTSKELGST